MITKRRTLQIFGLVLFCLFLATVLKTQAQKYEALLGIWDVQTENGTYTFTFEFTMKDETLKGKFTGSSGEAEMEGLSFEENTLKFSVSVNELTIDFSATIEGDSLEGMLSLEYGEASITGTKRKK